MTNPSPLLYTIADVFEVFGQKEVTKAQAYLAGAVQNLQVHGNEISATVEGTARRPYAVKVTFSRDGRGMARFYTDCTCPVGIGCKHAVAALLMGLKHQVLAQRFSSDSAAVLRWAEAFKTSLSAKPGKEVLIYRIRLHAPHSHHIQIDMEKARLASMVVLYWKALSRGRMWMVLCAIDRVLCVMKTCPSSNSFTTHPPRSPS